MRQPTACAGRAAGAIAVLEDVGERPYRLDRALTQLLRSGWFDDVRGVVCGQFTDCEDPDQVRAMLDARLGGLGVPTASKNKAAAIALVEWLSAKKQQVTMWTSPSQGGHFPSNSQAAADPAVSGARSAYFSNAPVGTIFGDIASQMKIPPIGLYDTQIQQALTTQLTNVETKGTSPDQAF